jgi:hypothetical protein
MLETRPLYHFEVTFGAMQMILAVAVYRRTSTGVEGEVFEVL